MRAAATHNPGLFGAILVLATAPGVLLIHGDRSSLVHIAGWIIPALLAWGWLAWNRNTLAAWPSWAFWLVFFLIRAPWFTTLPVLSDDFYRFIWDGHSWIQGTHAFACIPQEHPLKDQPPFESLFPLLNSPGYYTIYPGPSQAFFAMSAWVGGHNLFLSVTTLRLCWLGMEVLGLLFMRKMVRTGTGMVGLDWTWMLFPILVQEGIGNIHSELPALTGLGLMVLGMQQRSSGQQLAGLTVAIQFKLMPLFLLGCCFWHETWPVRLRWWGTTMGLNALLLGGLFFRAEYFQHFLASIHLYTETFRFNSGPFELFQWLNGTEVWISGRIFQLMSWFLIAVVTIRGWQRPAGIPFAAMGGILSLYWLGSPVIHPWYLLLPVFMLLFTRQYWGWVWIIASMLTYITYSVKPYHEHTWVMLVEYILLGAAFLHCIIAPGWKRQ